MTNEQLVKGIKYKDEVAFDEIYNQYYKLLYFIMYQIVGSTHETEELLQEVFMKIYNSINTYNNGSFKYWIIQIAKNTALNHVTRTQIKHKKVGNSEEVVANTQSKNQNLDRINELLSSHFSDEIRQVILYRAIFGYSYKDISEIIEKDVLDNIDENGSLKEHLKQEIGVAKSMTPKPRRSLFKKLFATRKAMIITLCLV